MTAFKKGKRRKKKKGIVKEAEGRKRKYGFPLTLLSGCLIVSGGAFFLNQILRYTPTMVNQGYYNFTLALINGFGVAAGGLLSHYRGMKMGGFLSIIYAVASIITGVGFINMIGAVIGLIGGVLIYLKK